MTENVRRRFGTVLAGGALSLVLLAALLAALTQSPQQTDRPARDERRVRSDRGPEERERPRGERRGGRGQRGFADGGPNCDNTSVGLTPLTELVGAKYEGVEGGLYPGVANKRPAAHEAAGRALAEDIGPLNSNGAPDPNGRYVLLSIGMSNTQEEFKEFARFAGSDPAKDDRLVVVNGAQGGMTASLWANPQDRAWQDADAALASAGVTPEQVAVAWVKVADRLSRGATVSFDDYTEGLRAEMESVARILTDRYPNLKLAYYSSRIYGGYADPNPGNPEPFAYQSGFSVRQLIADQINGAPDLNFDPAEGPVEAPWLSWGPYLWADGTDRRNDGLTWECSDFRLDGTHPTGRGAEKVAQLLLDFMHTDSTATRWYSN